MPSALEGAETSAVEARRLAQQNGIRLWVSGADLILDAEREPEAKVPDAIRRNKAEIVALLGTDHDDRTTEDWLTLYEKGAGFAEPDGGQSREQARAMAFACCVDEWMNRHPCRTDPSRCAARGAPEQEGDAVVTIGSETHSHTWLHPDCRRGWHEAWTAEAVSALSAKGIENPGKFPEEFEKNGSE